MKRVMIIGQPGAGKSWLARRLGEMTGLPVYHVDQIHWLPGWVQRPMRDRIRLSNGVEARDEWIYEGGLSATWDNRLDRADTLICLDMPFALRIWRVFWRTLRDFGDSRPDLPEGCPESFDPEFWRYIWRTRRSARVRMQAFTTAAGKRATVYHFRSPREVRAFLRDLGPHRHGAGIPAPMT
ncbi:AAA family ATPase [Rhodobacterales bacterium HKCCE2091]|nr:AAA family ATPase [Rhodobacterales bacterium HKCCE2091]